MPDEPLFRRLRWPVAWAAFILTMTSLPGGVIPTAGAIPHADKFAHFALYAVFGALLLRARMTAGATAPVARILVAILVFAALDEWHQQFIPGREMDAFDWAADTLGALLGMVIFFLAKRRREQTT